MFTKPIRKTIGKLYTCETSGKRHDLMERLKTLIAAMTSEEKARAIFAAITVEEKARDYVYYKNRKYFNRLNQYEPDVTNAWTNAREDGESWKHVFIIRARSIDAAAALAGSYIDLDGNRCRCEHDCCGHSFHTSADIRPMKGKAFKRVTKEPRAWIVTQWGGINV